MPTSPPPPYRPDAAPAAPFLGVLSLDTAFPRILGDAGNPNSYPFDAEISIVEGAESRMIVQDGPLNAAMLARFQRAAVALEARGAAAIVSTCGFLAHAQRDVVALLRGPAMLSALSLFPFVQAVRPGRVGILTASRVALGPNTLRAAGIPADAVSIVGLEDAPSFAATFLARRTEQRRTIDPGEIGAEVAAAARRLVAADPALGAIILECGNLPPYAEIVRQETGAPVFHLIDAARMLMASRSELAGRGGGERAIGSGGQA